MMYLVALLAIGGSFVLSALATPLAMRLSHRLGMLDTPGGHKAHAKPVPMLGGSAIFGTILMISLFAIALTRYWAAVGAPAWLPAELAIHLPGVAARAPVALGILAGAALLHVVGLIDDRRDLGPWIKLAAQVGVAVFVVLFCNVRILIAAGPWISGAVTVFWIVAITNAFNFLDNMDGLAAGVAAIVAASFLAASARMGQLFVPAWLCLILGSLCGFLLYNFPPAKVFMGDAGSLVVGYMLAVMSCLTTYVSPGETFYAYGVFVPLVLMAVPLYDMASVITLRLRDHKSPMVGDQRHFSHRLIRRGMSVRKAALTIYLCTAATAISATLLARVDTVGAVLVFSQTVIILAVLALLESGNARS